MWFFQLTLITDFFFNTVEKLAELYSTTILSLSVAIFILACVIRFFKRLMNGH